jgi:thiamine pyrophosphokinase
MSKTCCIVAAGPSEAYFEDGAYIIAADAGIKKLNALGINADLIIGDFDSSEEKPKGDNVITFPIKKDDTDTLLALKEAIKRGFDRVIISGGVGGELDHTIANIQTLDFALEQGIRAYLVGEGYTVTVIDNASSLSFVKKDFGRCSVFAYGGYAGGVNICGLKYEAENITLTPSFPIGVSNSFVSKKAEISVREGRLLIIWQGSAEDVK